MTRGRGVEERSRRREVEVQSRSEYEKRSVEERCRREE